jgi:hypothetical protein
MIDSLLLIIGVVVIVAIILIAYILLSLKKRGLSTGHRKEILSLWKKIENEGNGSLQVLGADAVLDRTLSLLGFTGTLGEKLKKAGQRFSSENDVWWAHKLRNQLAHDPHFLLSKADADRAKRIFRKALADLGV